MWIFGAMIREHAASRRSINHPPKSPTTAPDTPQMKPEPTSPSPLNGSRRSSCNANHPAHPISGPIRPLESARHRSVASCRRMLGQHASSGFA